MNEAFSKGRIESNGVELLQSGSSFFSALKNEIDAAQFEIFFDTYIFESDETGKAISDALVQASNRGVKVYMRIDDFGSKDLSAQMIQQWKDSKINLKQYGKIFGPSGFHLARRLHRKITVIDRDKAFVGGINISNHYNAVNGSVPWLDFAVKIEGNAVMKLYRICKKRWRNTHVHGIDSQQKLNYEKLKTNNSGNTALRIRENDWIKNKRQCLSSYLELIKHAQKEIVIAGGYFLPGGSARRQMKKTIDRGVKIKLIVAGISDVSIMVNARRYLYNWMIRHGVEIYEYQPANVHAKIILCDDEYCSIGSFDLNNLSAFSNIECNVDIIDKNFCFNFHTRLKTIMENDCEKITSEKIEQFHWWLRFKLWLSYYSVKSLFGLSYWLVKKGDEEYQ